MEIAGFAAAFILVIAAIVVGRRMQNPGRDSWDDVLGPDDGQPAPPPPPFEDDEPEEDEAPALTDNPDTDPDEVVAGILVGLLEGLITPQLALAAWPVRPISVPEAKSYVQYFIERQQGTTPPMPGMEDMIRDLARHLKNKTGPAAKRPSAGTDQPWRLGDQLYTGPKPDDRSPGAVLARLMVCLVASQRTVPAIALQQGTMDMGEAQRRVGYLKHMFTTSGLDRCATRDEHRGILSPTGQLHPNLLMALHWRTEAATSLAWALSYTDAIQAPQEPADIDTLDRLIPPSIDALRTLHAEARLRPQDELEAMAARLRQEFVETKAQRDANPGDQESALPWSRAAERYRAIQWLLGTRAFDNLRLETLADDG